MRKILVISAILINVTFSQNDGFVVTKYPSGAIHTEGNYNNGVRNGLWTIWYEGEVFQDFGADGEPNTQDEGENNSKWDSTETVILDLDGDTFFDPPQKKEEGSYIEGNRNNTWVKWYQTGHKQEEGNFKEGKLHGSLTKWYENGNKSQEGLYDVGKQEGDWIWYYQSGIKKEKTVFKDGQQEGLWIQWFNDGTKRSERKFSNGERDSIWTSWYKNGNKKLQASYDSGKLTALGPLGMTMEL